jgi:DNA (cytosine-5)-methyltransferase 1
LGGVLLGWRTVCAVEIDAYCREILLARQRDGILPRFPIWDDVRTFDGTKWRGYVDVISGGFPCQDISCAGKGVGIEGERSGLWSEFARIIGEVGPRYVFVENVSALLVRGMGRVLGDLAEMGYDCRWGVLGADELGFSQHRERIWILADTNNTRREGTIRQRESDKAWEEWAVACRQSMRSTRGHWPPGPCSVSDIPILADGVADRMDRLRALGNGQVPGVAALAWRILSGGSK